MTKRHLWAVVCLVSISVALTLPTLAQDTPPTEDPVVAEAVATLIAQTQQAPMQISMTQTIQAALENALTATAQAPTAAPGSTTMPPAIDVEALEVASVNELDLRAGAANRGAFLAPDGEKFLYVAGPDVCVYEGMAAVGCIDLEAREIRALDQESFRWSPDSRYVVFHEDFFRFFNDPDIWVWDTTTETLSNLTDDNTDEISITDEVWDNVDVAPTWTADGNIVFARYRRDRSLEEPTPPDLYRIAPDGSDLTLLGSFNSTDPYSIFSLSTMGNQLLSVYFATADSPNNGVWRSDLDGSNAEQIAQADREEEIVIYTATPSADGRYLLIHTPFFSRAPSSADESMMRLVEVESGRLLLIDPEHFVTAAGWAPDGSTLAYTVYDPEDETNNGLYVTGTPGKAGRLLVEGNFIGSTTRQSLPLVWAANNTLLVSARPDFNLTLIELEG